jgi:beta-galactosidase GanA
MSIESSSPENARTPSERSWAGGYLAVDGKPFPVIGAEVHNSSSSSIPAIEASFTTVQELGANTVLAPVAWDPLEPSEGAFDFTLLDRMIHAARELGLRLIPLWFGSWKNAVSTYVPAWVKTDVARFPRSQLSDGSRVEQVTPFGMAARDADAFAFAALLRHIREVDADRTVIAIQVENEIGLLGDSRDRSAFAEHAFASPVPAAVVKAIAGDESAPRRR